MFPRSPRIVLGLIGGLLPLTSLAGLVSLGGITPQTSIPTAYTSQCISNFPYGFYEGQSFRAYETQTPNTLGSSREMLDPTNVRIYNPYGALGNTLNSNTLGGLLPAFFYTSNGRPGTNHFNFGGISTLLVYKQSDLTYTTKPSPTPNRNAIAAQIVHNLWRRQISGRGSLTNIYTMNYVGLNGIGGSFTSNPSARYPAVNDYECQNFYIAKCGDGVQDNPNKAGTASTNGKLGILINGTILPWTSTAPAEECDGSDGTPAGYICDSSCKLVQNILQPKCTLAPAQQTATCGQSALLNFNSSNVTSISNLVNISGGIILPNQAGRINVSPTQTTTYSFTVNGMAGSTPSICTATVNVIPAAQPNCTLTPAQQTITAGQNALLNFNSTFTTTISNLVGISGGIIMPNQAGRFNVSPTQTTNYSFTVNGGACTVPKTCNATVTVTPAPQPILHIDKTLISNIFYHSGDLVGFKVEFSNTGSGTAHQVVLEDDLPLSLAYVSSSLHGVVPPYQFGTGMIGPNTSVTYSGFDLAPGQTGYMIITGRVISLQLCQSDPLNTSYISSLEVQPPKYDGATYSCYTPSTNLSIIKTINKNVFSLGEAVPFTLTITNNGPDIANSVQIGDLRPNSACILPATTYTSNYPLTVNSANPPYLRTLIPQLPVGQSLIINFTGTVANNPSCAGSYLNTGTLSYTVNGQTKTGISSVPFVVSTMSVSFVKTILQAGSTHGDSVTFALDYKNEGTTTLSTYSIVDYWPSTLSFVNASPMPNSQSMTVGGSLLNWTSLPPLGPNGTGRIIINGKIN